MLHRTPDSDILVVREQPSPYGKRTDHDRLFKELLQTFLAEFVQLFFPKVYESIDFSRVTFLPQEVFTDVTKGERRSIDILAEATFRGRKTVIIVHLEHQSYKQPDFHERMFVYFSRLYEKYRRPILPIAVFSHRNEAEEPDRFEVTFPFKDVLQFSFYTVQLHKKNWRAYLRSDNPVAAALLSQMNYRPEERVQVKKEFLRMLTRLELDPARMQLIVGFFEQYVQLTEEEEEELKKELEQLEGSEAEDVFRIETSWERKGRMIGKEEGKTEARREFAGRLLEKGMSIEEVMSLTDLTRDEVDKLRS